MAVINKHFGFVFLAEPHTGSQATRDALCTLEGSVETNGEHHLDLPGCVQKGFLSKSEAEDFLVFSTIRDPHSLLLTRWLRHGQQENPFRVFLRLACTTEQQTLYGQCVTTLFWRTAGQVNWFIRYETLLQGLNTIVDSLGAPEFESLPLVGQTKDKPYWPSLWDEDLEEWSRVAFPDIYRYAYRAEWEASKLLSIEADSRRPFCEAPKV
jgi:hypothetical protein